MIVFGTVHIIIGIWETWTALSNWLNHRVVKVSNGRQWSSCGPVFIHFKKRHVAIFLIDVPSFRVSPQYETTYPDRARISNHTVITKFRTGEESHVSDDFLNLESAEFLCNRLLLFLPSPVSS